MDKKLVFSQEIDMTRVINNLGIMSICDLGKNGSGKIEVVNQRDWKVPEFKDTVNGLLCAAFNCKSECDQCVVTRILEEK